MDDALAFYNAVVENQENEIFNWLSKHLNKMVNELENYVNTSFCYFDNVIKETNYGSSFYRTSQERVEGDDFWIAKSNKISEALLFLDNIKALPVQVNPKLYVDKIYNINKVFLPKLIEKIQNLEIDLKQVEEQIVAISNEMPLSLYIRLHEKYYWSKNWYLSSNRFSMIMFLMRILRRKSNMPISIIKSNINILDGQIKTWEDLKSKSRRLESVLNDLSKDKDKIITFFDSVENGASN